MQESEASSVNLCLTARRQECFACTKSTMGQTILVSRDELSGIAARKRLTPVFRTGVCVCVCVCGWVGGWVYTEWSYINIQSERIYTK